MRVLCVCRMGMNRSKYLAGYLKRKGHETKYGGVSRFATNPLTQEQVDWAETIITAKGWMLDALLDRYDAKDKKVIALSVNDNPLLIGTAALWCKILDSGAYQERHVYCRLREQIKQHLPLHPRLQHARLRAFRAQIPPHQ